MREQKATKSIKNVMVVTSEYELLLKSQEVSNILFLLHILNADSCPDKGEGLGRLTLDSQR